MIYSIPYKFLKIAIPEIQKLYSLFLIGLLILFFKPVAAQRTTVTLAWSPNTETNLAHYTLYRDTIPGTMKVLRGIPKTRTTYVDSNVVPGKTYYYKLTAKNSNGYESEPSNEVSVTVGVVVPIDSDKSNMIGNFALYQNYPNPFNPTSTIPYTLARDSKVTIIVYDLLGNEIRKLVDEYKAAGSYQTIWDGKNDHGGNVSSGVYLYQMTAENYVKVKKLILEK